MEGRIVVDTKTFLYENPGHSPDIYDDSHLGGSEASVGGTGMILT